MRGNLSTPYTTTGLPAALRRARVSSKPSTAHGPSEVHTTLVSRPKMPSRFSPCGCTRRCESRCSRSQTSWVLAGAASRSISTSSTRFSTRRRASEPSSAFSSAAGAASSGFSPSAGLGNHTSRTDSSAAYVVRPKPQAAVTGTDSRGACEAHRDPAVLADSARVSLAGAAVDALPDQVGVATVAGVLLDHVDEDVADRRRVPAAVVDERRRHGLVRLLVQPVLGTRDLSLPLLERLVDALLRPDRGGELDVRVVGVGVGPRLVDVGLQSALEPGVLDEGHVTHQAEQAEVARRHRPRRELLRRQVRALELEGEPIVAEIVAVRRQLTHRLAVEAWVLVGREPVAGVPGGGGHGVSQLCRAVETQPGLEADASGRTGWRPAGLTP